MARALVMCPATQSTVVIEYVDTPLGAMIHRCSRFQPSTAVACGRTCATSPRCPLASTEPSDVDAPHLNEP